MSEAVIIFLTMFFIIGLSLAPIYFIFRHYRIIYEKTKHQISDAEIFQLMARANHFLTPEQLAAVSSLNIKDAKNRLHYLAMQGALSQLGSSNGLNYVFQLKEDIPLSSNLPISLNTLTDQQVVDVVLDYSPDYQITTAELVVIFDIDIKTAKALLKRLKKSKLVASLWSMKGIIYTINSPLKQQYPKTNRIIEKTQTNKIKIEPVQKIKIPDADVLDLAIQHKGKLTPSLVCLKLKIPMEDAAQKLEQLYNKGAFVMDMDTESAIIEYHLRDKNLLD